LEGKERKKREGKKDNYMDDLLTWEGQLQGDFSEGGWKHL